MEKARFTEKSLTSRLVVKKNLQERIRSKSAKGSVRGIFRPGLTKGRGLG